MSVCPWRIHGERTQSLTVAGEYFYNEYFMPCLGDECPCYENGECCREYRRFNLKESEVAE